MKKVLLQSILKSCCYNVTCELRLFLEIKKITHLFFILFQHLVLLLEYLWVDRHIHPSMNITNPFHQFEHKFFQIKVVPETWMRPSTSELFLRENGFCVVLRRQKTMNSVGVVFGKLGIVIAFYDYVLSITGSWGLVKAHVITVDTKMNIFLDLNSSILAWSAVCKR